MSITIDWQAVEDASPENRELGEIVRRLGGFHGGNPSLDREESRRRSLEILQAELKSTAAGAELLSRLQGQCYEVGGDEHLVVKLEDRADRVYKLTHGDAFGCRPYFSRFDPDLSGKNFHGTINDDPVFYLKRWMLLNQLGEYQTRFEGILPPEENLRMPRICVSQPALDAPNPERVQIQKVLERFGFLRISLDAFLNAESGILLTDAAPRNVRIVDGAVALFDVIALVAGDDVLDWVKGFPNPSTR